MNEENVPKVMRMCIEEVEKRGLNVDKIYSVRLLSRHVFRYAKCPYYRLPYVIKNHGRPVECSADQSTTANMKYIQLLRSFESEESFSFTSVDNIHYVAVLLKVSY